MRTSVIISRLAFSMVSLGLGDLGLSGRDNTAYSAYTQTADLASDGCTTRTLLLMRKTKQDIAYKRDMCLARLDSSKHLQQHQPPSPYLHFLPVSALVFTVNLHYALINQFSQFNRFNQSTWSLSHPSLSRPPLSLASRLPHPPTKFALLALSTAFSQAPLLPTVACTSNPNLS